jgi:hypothetical protein
VFHGNAPLPYFGGGVSVAFPLRQTEIRIQNHNAGLELIFFLMQVEEAAIFDQLCNAITFTFLFALQYYTGMWDLCLVVGKSDCYY